jgi:hypothetical protein
MASAAIIAPPLMTWHQLEVVFWKACAHQVLALRVYALSMGASPSAIMPARTVAWSPALSVSCIQS